MAEEGELAAANDVPVEEGEEIPSGPREKFSIPGCVSPIHQK
jgi:hypothetical protein